MWPLVDEILQVVVAVATRDISPEVIIIYSHLMNYLTLKEANIYAILDIKCHEIS